MLAPLELRSIDLKIGIAADPFAVWQALTDATELTNWFPLQAEIEHGANGVMWLSWGGPVFAQWRIDIWNPGQELRVDEIRPLGVLLQPPGGGAGTRSLDFRLEARGLRRFCIFCTKASGAARTGMRCIMLCGAAGNSSCRACVIILNDTPARNVLWRGCGEHSVRPLRGCGRAWSAQMACSVTTRAA